MLADSALHKLTRDLASALGSMGLHSGEFGKPGLVLVPTLEAERIFQGYAKAKPNKDDAYAAARALLQGQPLDAWQRDLIASAVTEPIREFADAMVLGSPKFLTLLASYDLEVKRGELWRLTWHGLLYSYFNYHPGLGNDEQTRSGWEALRLFLARTWPAIDKEAGQQAVPDWIQVLRKEGAVLTTKPVEKYAQGYLRGEKEPVERLAADLGIPPSSWFWHALVLAAVRQATSASDADFRNLVSHLIELIQTKPGFRDEALEAILVRYHACRGAPPDEQLFEFVCKPTVWKNPKLKAARIATAWNRVPDQVCEMVLRWINGRNLKDFFDILASRNNADEGRLEFWSGYLDQISWTRLVFGADTLSLTRTNSEVRELIAREEGAYAQLTGRSEVDAFMMQIGSYIIIEFSKKPNACYVYEADQLPFEPYERQYDGGTADLAGGFRLGCALRIVHRDGWGLRAGQDLLQLGISPDKPKSRRADRDAAANTTANLKTTDLSNAASRWKRVGAPDMLKLVDLVGRFRGAAIDDKRTTTNGGRLWVEDSLQHAQLGSELKTLGFKWASSREAWYYPET